MVTVILALVLISAPAYAQTMLRAEVSANVRQVASVNPDGSFSDPTISPNPLVCNSDGTVTDSDGNITSVTRSYDGRTEVFYY